MSLTISPAALSFAPTPVGPACPGANCTYAEVTITNTGSATEHLIRCCRRVVWPFLADLRRHVQRAEHVLPAGRGILHVPMGLQPDKPGRVRDTGTMTFESGESVSVELDGRGTPH